MLRIDEKKRTGRGGVEFGDQRAKRNRFFFLTRHRANLLNAKASMVPPTSRVRAKEMIMMTSSTCHLQWWENALGSRSVMVTIPFLVHIVEGSLLFESANKWREGEGD